MAIGRSKTAAARRELDRLPDRLLVDIGFDPASVRRQDWSEFFRLLTRHLGSTRS